MTCEVCTKDTGTVVELRGFTMHRACAPKHWVKDDIERLAFMAKVDTWWETPAAAKWKKARQ